MSLAKLARASAVHVGVAFVAMGGWTLFANRAHGSAAIAPALAQGTISGLITLVLKRVLEAFSARLSGALAYVLPPLATASVILAVLIGVHRLIGTPEIARHHRRAVVGLHPLCHHLHRRPAKATAPWPTLPENRRPIKSRAAAGPSRAAALLATAGASPDMISAASVAFAFLGRRCCWARG